MADETNLRDALGKDAFPPYTLADPAKLTPEQVEKVVTSFLANQDVGDRQYFTAHAEETKKYAVGEYIRTYNEQFDKAYDVARGAHPEYGLPDGTELYSKMPNKEEMVSEGLQLIKANPSLAPEIAALYGQETISANDKHVIPNTAPNTTIDQTTLLRQKELLVLGIDPGPINGIPNPQTDKAMEELARRNPGQDPNDVANAKGLEETQKMMKVLGDEGFQGKNLAEKLESKYNIPHSDDPAQAAKNSIAAYNTLRNHPLDLNSLIKSASLQENTPQTEHGPVPDAEKNNAPKPDKAKPTVEVSTHTGHHAPIATPEEALSDPKLLKTMGYDNLGAAAEKDGINGKGGALPNPEVLRFQKDWNKTHKDGPHLTEDGLIGNEDGKPGHGTRQAMIVAFKEQYNSMHPDKEQLDVKDKTIDTKTAAALDTEYKDNGKGTVNPPAPAAELTGADKLAKVMADAKAAGAASLPSITAIMHDVSSHGAPVASPAQQAQQVFGIGGK